MSGVLHGSIVFRESQGRLEVLITQREDKPPSLLVFEKHSLELEEFRFEFENFLGVDFHLSHPLSLRPYGDTSLRAVLFWSDSHHFFPGFRWVDVESLEEIPEPLGGFLCEAMAQFWSILPLSHPLLSSLHPLHPELSKAELLTFYGGSFHPFHRGHLSCIQNCPSRPLVVVPDRNPFKREQGEHSYWRLYRELCLEAEGEEGVYVYPGFCGQQTPNPTVDWIKKVAVRKNLLMGDDCFMDLLRWKDAGRLIQELEGIFVVPRKVEDKDFFSQREKVRSHNTQIQISRLSRHDHEGLSSTHLRELD